MTPDAAGAPPHDDANPYNVIAYPSGCHSQTHPSRVAGVGFFHGFSAAPPSSARILELGCGDGWNLIPLGFHYPGSQCFGADLAMAPVTAGRRATSELGLSNVRLECADITRLSAPAGSVDYIIAHGVYSWVPDRVREALLSLCGRLLSDRGLAFISFNAMPGSHTRLMIREMLLRHAGSGGDPTRRLRQGRALLELLAEAADGAPAPRGALAAEYASLLRGPPGQLFHDEMADAHEAFYFSDFMARASVHGLDFVSDMEEICLASAPFPERVRRALEMAGDDRVRFEQYLDYFKLRRFRQVLLCRSGAFKRIPEGRAPLEGLYYGARLNGSEAPAHTAAGPVAEYSTQSGGVVATGSAMGQAVLAEFARHGCHPASWEELRRAAMASPAGAPGAGVVEDELRRMLASWISQGVLTLWRDPPPVPRAPGPRPLVNRLVRWQAARSVMTTTAYHQRVDVGDPILRRMLQLMDGTRETGEVTAALRAEFGAGAAEGDDEFERKAANTLAVLSKLGILADPTTETPGGRD